MLSIECLLNVSTAPFHVGRALVQPLWRGHGRLDGQATNVLPSLLQQRDEIVDGKHNVANQLILGHANIADCHTHAKNLLQLELDSRLDFCDFGGEIFGVGHWGREFTGYKVC